VTRQFDVASAVEDLRYLIAKADALAHAAENHCESVIQAEASEDRCGERLEYLIGETASAVLAALEAVEELAAQLRTGRPINAERSTPQLKA
jgi:hypothetical protein